MTERFTFPALDGIELEAALDGPDDPVGALALCHPHPKMGGTMNAPLLVALADHLVARGWAVLRFNFRGIGASEGESGTGAEEINDAGGALRVTAERYDLPRAIAGWSFGGAVAIRTAAATPGLGACVAISPAVSEKEGVTSGLPPPEELEIDCPLLVVCGANDDQVSPDAVRAWAEGADARYVELPGTNHFFWAKYDDLAETVAGFLAETTSSTGS
jgi:alpha/beta superfamily hydrolase